LTVSGFLPPNQVTTVSLMR